MKLKIRLSNNKIIAGALMSIALINSGCNDFLNKVQPQGQESSITFMPVSYTHLTLPTTPYV